MPPFQLPEKPQRVGRGEFTDPSALPPVQRALHRRQMAAIRAARKVDPGDVDSDRRHWPGLSQDAGQGD
jgi:hypothetical protein